MSTLCARIVGTVDKLPDMRRDRRYDVLSRAISPQMGLLSHPAPRENIFPFPSSR